MSETPRTQPYFGSSDTKVVNGVSIYEHAVLIETELNAANKRVEELDSAIIEHESRVTKAAPLGCNETHLACINLWKVRRTSETPKPETLKTRVVKYTHDGKYWRDESGLGMSSIGAGPIRNHTWHLARCYKKGDVIEFREETRINRAE